ncbi:hypothetical protein [Micromonospora rubida]|uniref:hypothetical protein n=1 Tax=Micromonospora rubida TaxID=2697657 RepID=UPI0013773C6A|nr:hypothetical protein [Micromonospora rubida]NBE84937.1 hypothetical protein [Micromonospora rubida]
MWPWRRRTQETAQRSTADVPAPPTDSSPARTRSEPPAWQSLPPLQRVTPDEPRLNLPDTFTGSLAAWRDPSYLAPLGHLVGAAEPAGVLHETAVPVSEPHRSVPEPVGRTHGDHPEPLPLATPSADSRPPAPSLQRQAAGPPGTTPVPEHPLAVPAQGRAVPVEPVTVSRLLTAPPPPEELLLPAVDRPVDPTPRAARPDAASPETPTLGSAAAAGPLTPGSTGTLTPGSAGPSAPDLPVQRLVGDGPRPPRRLGLGEPIVSPVLPPVPRPTGDAAPPSVQRSTAGQGPEQVRRSAAGEGQAGSPLPPAAAPPVQRSPAGGSGPVTEPGATGRPADASDAGNAGDAGDAGDTGGVAPASDSTTLVGSRAVTVSRLDTEAFPIGLGPSPVGPQAEAGTADGGENLVGGPPPPVEGLPLAGTPRGDAPPARWAGGAADPGTGGPAPVQTFVPPAGETTAGGETPPSGDTPPSGETTASGDTPPSGETTAGGDVPAGAAGMAPLLGGPPASVPSGGASSAGGPAAGAQAVEPAGGPGAGSGGPDLPVVARLATSGTPTGPRAEGPSAGTGPVSLTEASAGTGPVPHTEASAGTGPVPHSGASAGTVDPYDGGPSPVGGGAAGWEAVTDGGPEVAGLVGGDGGAAAGPAGPEGVDAGGSPSPPLPLVVARLVGDRPPALLTGAGPVAPLPDRPAVQRVTWQRDEPPADGGRAGTTADPERAVPVDLYPPPAAPDPSTAPGTVPGIAPGTAASTGAARSTSAEAGGGLPPVQRWVGAIPGTPSARRPQGRDTAPPGPPLSAYTMGELSGPVVQRAEPADDAAPPPLVDAPAPPAAAPPPDSGGAAAGRPAAPGAAPGGGAEPEELLKKLYDPLLRRLKTELRLDRERHGALGGPG